MGTPILFLAVLLAVAAPAQGIRAPEVAALGSGAALLGKKHKKDGPHYAEDCTPRQIHLAFGSSADEMVMQWAAGKPDCHADVTFGPSGSDSMILKAKATELTLSPRDFCQSPAATSGRDLFFYRAQLTDLEPDMEYDYQIAGSSKTHTFRAAPAVGEALDPYPYTFVAYGDMGEPEDKKAKSPGAGLVADQSIVDVSNGARMVLQIGDISYANGLQAVWDNFMEMIAPMAMRVPYMVGIGNHDYDYSGGVEHDPSGASKPYLPSWGNYKPTGSGGECGVATWARFEMPSYDGNLENGASNATFNAPFWYSFDLATTHFVVVSSEHDLMPGSRQWQWLHDELAAVDRCVTPWVVLAIHRPLYVLLNHHSNRIVAEHLRAYLEPVLDKFGVNYVINGHVHSYSRTCKVADAQCTDEPALGRQHFIIGSGGRKLSKIKKMSAQDDWLEYAEQTWGHGRFTVHSAREATMEFVRGHDGKINDSAKITNHVTETGFCHYRFFNGEAVDATPEIDADVTALYAVKSEFPSLLDALKAADEALVAHEAKVAELGIEGLVEEEMDWGADSLADDQSLEENLASHDVYSKAAVMSA